MIRILAVVYHFLIIVPMFIISAQLSFFSTSLHALDKKSTLEVFTSETVHVVQHPHLLPFENYQDLIKLIGEQTLKDINQVPKGIGSMGGIGMLLWASYYSPGLGMLAGWLINPFFAPMIKSITYYISFISGNRVQSSERKWQKHFDILQRYYLIKKHLIPQITRSRIEHLMLEAQQLIFAYVAPLFSDMGDHKSDYPIFERIYRIESILQIPFGRAIIVNKPEEGKDELRKLMSTYDNILTNQILDVFDVVSHSDTVPRILKNGAVLRSSHHYYFLGKPGVGKTVTAKNLGKTLGLPFCELGLAELFEDTTDQTNFNDIPLGKITKCFIQSDNGLSGINPIIYIDEPDRAANAEKNTHLLGELLKLLNSGNAFYFDKHLGVQIPLTQTTFIMSGNNFITDLSKSFEERMTQIVFPDLTRKQKESIGRNLYQDIFGINMTDKSESQLQELLNTTENEAGMRSLERKIISL